MVSMEALRIMALACSGKYEVTQISTMDPMRAGGLGACTAASSPRTHSHSGETINAHLFQQQEHATGCLAMGEPVVKISGVAMAP